MGVAIFMVGGFLFALELIRMSEDGRRVSASTACVSDTCVVAAVAIKQVQRSPDVIRQVQMHCSLLQVGAASWAVVHPMTDDWRCLGEVWECGCCRLLTGRCGTRLFLPLNTAREQDRDGAGFGDPLVCSSEVVTLPNTHATAFAMVNCKPQLPTHGYVVLVALLCFPTANQFEHRSHRQWWNATRTSDHYLHPRNSPPAAVIPTSTARRSLHGRSTSWLNTNATIFSTLPSVYRSKAARA